MAPVLQIFAVIIAAAILPAPTSAHNILDLHYAVTVSSQLRAGNEEKVCLQIHHISDQICVTIKLEMPSGPKKTIIMEKAIKRNFYECYKFKVPRVSSRTVANISVLIESPEEDVIPIVKKSKVLILPPFFIHIVRTNQPIYKPGKNVMFRIVSMNTDFIPVKRVYKMVEVKDPNGNRIAQWLNTEIEEGILDLSHQLISEAVEGIYRINAETNKEERITHTFKVEEFVLPKYDVQLHVPSAFTVFDKEIKFKICGKYTYGKPVNGSVKAVFCAKGYRYKYYWGYYKGSINNCTTYWLSTDRSGCATQVVNITELFTSTNVITYFEVSAVLTEYGTGVTLSENGRIYFTQNLRRARIVDAATSFKHGLNYEFKIKLTGPDHGPVPHEKVTVSSPYSPNLRVTTDSRGIAKVSLDTVRWRGSVYIRAVPLRKSFPHTLPYQMRPYYYSDSHRAIEFYSKNKNFVQLQLADEDLPCDRDATINAQYILQGKELRKWQDSFKFYFLVISKGKINQHGHVEASVTSGVVNKGNLSLTFDHVVNLAPIAQVIIYTVLQSGEMVADSRNYPVQLCFNNKVSLRFPKHQLLPAQKTNLHLKAEPGSLCSVRAIDLSLLHLEQQQALTTSSMYSRLPLKKLSGYYYAIEDNEPYPCLPDGEPPISLKAYGLSYYPQYYQKNDAYSRFKEVGAKLLTNMKIKKPRSCQVVTPTPYYITHFWPTFGFWTSAMTTTSTETTTQATWPSTAFATFGSTTSFSMASTPFPTTRAPARLPSRPEVKKEVIRKVFPETWIWDLVSVGDEGWTNVRKTVPDTITKWVAGAFCVSPVGFGVSPNTGLTAFKPFFVSTTLPYSVTRGESFRLRATVFSYLSNCFAVNATLAASDQYTLKNCAGCRYSVCLCGGESKTFSWIVTPTALGQVSLRVSAEAMRDFTLCKGKPSTVLEVGQRDTVIRKLLVEAEGTPQSVSHSTLLCPTGKTIKEKVSLVLPENFVKGSPKALVSVVGDIMSPILKNIDNLLRMPYGCGEQNLLTFAPNSFILEYLNSTKQLTAEILNRGKRYQTAGYQRQLKYKHRDGSYSAFGKRDISGNTWLTAFVMKAFFRSQEFIYVENRHIDEAKGWLSSKQGPDGCIRSVGKLFNSAMKGGVKDEVTLTAYVIAAMLEVDEDVTDSVVVNGLMCLRKALKSKIDNLYTVALLSYTFTLAKEEKMRLKLIQELHANSTSVGGTRYWTRSQSRRTSWFSRSLDVEMTSYVLLALLSGPTLPGFNVGYSTTIVRWLVQQRNPWGGFSSTQDTVVALQALSKYAGFIFSTKGKTVVTVKSKGTSNLRFIVNKSNKLLYQERSLSKVSGDYVVFANGKRCVLVQISMTYNIPPPKNFSNFNIVVSTKAKCRTSKTQLSLSVEVSYQGQRSETNMVIVDVKLLSGYTQKLSSLQLSNPSASQVEVAEGHALLYVYELRRKEKRTFFLQMVEEESVSDRKPAPIKVYDYYMISEEAVTTYSSSCDDLRI